MSKKNSRVSSRVLLDTSFLLPVLGFETSDRVMRVFQKLGSYELYYSEISILEALWKIVKTIKGVEEELARIEEGVIAIRESMKHAPINSEAVKNAIHMYKLSHKDMVDNLLYSIAASNKLRFLTVDEELVEFIEKNGLAREYIATPEELG
ncbi:MAG: PIN domain-containing protein [Desulfurococcus sp.]|uniref:PIN domain-containing protein n=1 Tax=Desulfurococcus sp. TaxID=51678 RepID=UPI003167C179